MKSKHTMYFKPFTFVPHRGVVGQFLTKGEGSAMLLQLLTKGEERVRRPHIFSDVICEQPLMHFHQKENSVKYEIVIHVNSSVN